MVNVSVMGIAGRMGRSISQLLIADPEIRIVGATEKSGSEYVGKSLSDVLGIDTDLAITIDDDIKRVSSNADVIVDFTSPETTIKNASYCSNNDKAMVIGTTGFSHSQEEELTSLAKSFPCVLSPNMSIGVNVLFEISKMVANLLGKEFDVEIIEAHHRNKIDSPSGTALRLGQSVAEGLNLDFEDVVRFKRHGNIGERKTNEIGIQTVRGGDVVGDHTVMFLGSGERIELTHRALSRDNFSKGVLRAVKWVADKPSGIYSMKDVLGF